MESEIEFLKSELEACKIREETTKKLYDSLMRSMQDSCSQSIEVIKN
jgi:hypothetical protein